MDKDLVERGLEILPPHEHIRVSRFPVQIRWLHWLNTLFIFLLYFLAINQITEFSSIGHFSYSDSRFWHATTGVVWIMTLLIMVVIIFFGRLSFKKAIVSDKLIIKQQAFLVFSIGFILLMMGSGLGMFLLQDLDTPEIRSILLSLHLFLAVSYLPALGFHVYLATIKQDTRNSLRTMISDVTLQYILHAEIEGLQCFLSDVEQRLYLKADVHRISIKGFRANLKNGLWQEKVDLSQMTQVQFIHPDLHANVTLPIVIDSLFQDRGPPHGGPLHGLETQARYYAYATSVQESTRLLLSHAFFFRKLFLEDRIFHRLPLEISVTVIVKTQKYVGVTVDISKGGIGVALPLKIPHREIINLELEFSQKHYHFKGKIVMKRRWEDKQFFYGIAFINLTQDELESVDKIIASLERYLMIEKENDLLF